MPFPNLIIAGPPKTGSTSLYSWLSDHPECLPSNVKETNYFYDQIVVSNREANYLTHGLSKYEQYFDKYLDQKVIFEASPGYTFSESAIKGIQELPSKPEIVLVYRKPSGRLFSEYRFHKYKLKIFNGNFAEFTGWNGQHFSGLHYERGRLNDHFHKWIETFGDRVKVIRFDDLTADSRNVMIALAKWLKIDHTFFERYHFETKNETFGLRNRSLHVKALNLARFVPKWIRNILTPIYYGFNKTSIPETAQEDLEILEILQEAYSDQSFEAIPKNARLTIGS